MESNKGRLSIENVRRNIANIAGPTHFIPAVNKGKLWIDKTRQLAAQKRSAYPEDEIDHSEESDDDDNSVPFQKRTVVLKDDRVRFQVERIAYLRQQNFLLDSHHFKGVPCS